VSAPAATTLVVLTRNRWPDLARTLPRHEAPVILVDNGSTDGTPDLVRSHFPAVRVVQLDTNRGALGRNVGVDVASTPLVAFADDDSWWEPGALRRAEAVFEQYPHLGLLAARILVGADNRLDPACRLMQCSAVPVRAGRPLPGPAVLGFVACGAVVRREAFRAAGGFDSVVFFAGEEERLALDLRSAGWDLAYVEEVVAHHDPSPRRAPRRRQVLVARNDLLTALMRRPWRVVTGRVLGAARAGIIGWAGLGYAVPRVPSAIVRRRRLPEEVERAARAREQGT